MDLRNVLNNENQPDVLNNKKQTNVLNNENQPNVWNIKIWAKSVKCQQSMCQKSKTNHICQIFRIKEMC